MAGKRKRRKRGKRVSQYFGLRWGQPELDFVDVDVVCDVPLYIHPRALRLIPTSWGQECVSLIQDYFDTVVTAIREGNHDYARRILRGLREPNETHLGLSEGRSRGRALGTVSARSVWEALLDSEAVKSGLLEDLEETILVIEGVGSDIVSDMITNIIREPLIRYTQEQCREHRIPMQNEVESGPLWDPNSSEWEHRFEQLPIAANRKLLLVPKVIVRRDLDCDTEEYFRHYILPHMQAAELGSNTELVHLLKDGRRRVTKTDLIRKYGGRKSTIVSYTKVHPEILAQYRQARRARERPSLTHEDFQNLTGCKAPDWDALLDGVTSIAPGTSTADDYHRSILRLFTALFSPSLSHPEKETRLHNGRKRVDITFYNTADLGFFAWLRKHHPCSYIFVECKNYSGDPGNPELDQLSGRFSPSRGRVGILVCRSIVDKELFIHRCRDTAQDDRGFVIPLDDDDIRMLVEARKAALDKTWDFVLKDLFEQLVL